MDGPLNCCLTRIGRCQKSVVHLLWRVTASVWYEGIVEIRCIRKMGWTIRVAEMKVDRGGGGLFNICVEHKLNENDLTQ